MLHDSPSALLWPFGPPLAGGGGGLFRHGPIRDLLNQTRMAVAPVGEGAAKGVCFWR